MKTDDDVEIAWVSEWASGLMTIGEAQPLTTEGRDTGTWRTIRVPSLDGVMAGSLSTSSWTIIVFTDSVSPLLRFRDDLWRQSPQVKDIKLNLIIISELWGKRRQQHEFPLGQHGFGFIPLTESSLQFTLFLSKTLEWILLSNYTKTSLLLHPYIK